MNKLLSLLFIFCFSTIISCDSQDDVNTDSVPEQLESLTNKGDAEDQYKLGNIYLAGKEVERDLQKSFSFYKLAAEKNHIEAQYSLGVMYQNGIGTKQSSSEALKWYKLAAEKGHKQSQFQVGLMYHKGEGVEQNYEEAKKWYKLAAEQGHVTAQNNLKSLSP